MTETVLELVSVWGVPIIFTSTFLSCLFLPIPSSLMMLAGGAFVAAGDLGMAEVAGAAWLGAVLGDQAGYRIGRRGGETVILRLSENPSRARLLKRAERVVKRHGGLAVFFSRWAFSQIGPWVNVIAGAARLNQWRFAAWDAAGEVIWVAVYVGAGYLFASEIEAAVDIIGNASALLAAGAVTVGLGLWLRGAMRHRTEKRRSD